MKTTLGVDIGGTKIFSGVYDETGHLLRHDLRPTQAERGKDHVMEHILASIHAVRDENLGAIGLSWAGFVRSEEGLILEAPNIPGFEHVPLARIIADATGLPCVIENDARLMALAVQQTLFPADRIFLGIIVGTGVGMGIILDGKPFRGAQGFAGEIGHTRWGDTTRLEEKLAGGGLEKALDGTRFASTYDVGAFLQENPHTLPQEIEDYVQLLSYFVYNLSLVWNPDRIFFSGGVGEHIYPFLLPEVTKRVKQMLEERSFPTSVSLETGKMEYPGALGAALLAREENVMTLS